MGMLPEEPGGRRTRRRRIHQPAYHSRHRKGVRRFRRRRDGRGCKPETIGAVMIEGSDEKKLNRRLRLGMVGGGQGAFIGAVHRMVSRIDDRWEFVAGALSSDPAR